jgi:arginase
MENNPTVHLLGVASGIGAGDQGCSQGPLALQNDPKILEGLPIHWVWENMIYPPEGSFSRLGAMDAISEVCQKLAYEVNDFIANEQKFAVIGGDHSIAMGTWSGMAHALRKEGNIGLIWFDAHLDSHTPSTTESGNIHGMPVAHLLGYGETALCTLLDSDPKLRPENVCFIGIRSYEAGELQLLKKLNVKIFFIEEVLEKGMMAVMQEAIAHVSRHTTAYGISIDLDGIDPVEAPGVGTPEENGVKADDFISSLSLIHNDPKCLGVEVVEFNPGQDKNDKTKKIMRELLKMVFLGPSAKKSKNT